MKQPLRLISMLGIATFAGVALRLLTPVAAYDPMKARLHEDIKTESFFGPVSPFCSDAGGLRVYLTSHGFVEEGRLTFDTGAAITRYHFLGDTLWLARAPDGKSCLLAKGALEQDPLPPRGCRYENMCPKD